MHSMHFTMGFKTDRQAVKTDYTYAAQFTVESDFKDWGTYIIMK